MQFYSLVMTLWSFLLHVFYYRHDRNDFKSVHVFIYREANAKKSLLLNKTLNKIQINTIPIYTNTEINDEISHNIHKCRNIQLVCRSMSICYAG